jgi:hypothetical protein
MQFSLFIQTDDKKQTCFRGKAAQLYLPQATRRKWLDNDLRPFTVTCFIAYMAWHRSMSPSSTIPRSLT